MEPCSYVKGSCGSDFAVFFIPAGNEPKSCLHDLDDCREVFHFILGNVVVVDYLRGGGGCAVDISVAGGDNIFNGKQEVKRQSMRL